MYTALYIVLVIVGIVLILALIAPKSYNVFRTIEISKSRMEVFEYLKYLKKQEEWSPWATKDPNMEREYSGTDGEVGVVYHWKGNKEVGEGEQEITNIVDGKRIDGELRFLKPWKSTSDCYLEVEDGAENTTKVVWGFKGKNKFPMSIMMLFMNMDKMVGKDFEEGLRSLKSKLESN